MSTTTFRLKRSSVAGKIPTIGQLDLGEVAINTYDGLMFIKKSVNGTESIVKIGEQSGASYEEFYFSADSNQTVFTGADLDSDTLGYTPSLVNVYLNGVLLDSANDFVSNDGTTITLNTGANSGDILQVQSFTQGLQVAEYNYTATASQTTFIGLDDNNRTLRYATGKVEGERRRARACRPSPRRGRTSAPCCCGRRRRRTASGPSARPCARGS